MTNGNETNQACWLDAAGADFVVREAPLPRPGPDEVVIRTHAIALNPVEAIRQEMGLFVPDGAFPWIIGSDGAGVVQAVGDSVTHLNTGDRVTALSNEFNTHKSEDSSFQRYFRTVSEQVAKIPDGLTFEEAVVLPLALSTAAGALFERESMDLGWPRLNNSDEKLKQSQAHAKEVVIVWGGSSVVGLCAIQMLVLAGYQVVATAAEHNFKLVESAGAGAAFDYRDDACVDLVVDWVKSRGLTSAGVLAAVIDRTGKSFDQCANVVKQIPGRKLVGTTMARGMMELPHFGDEIKTTACFAIQEADLLEYVWKHWMPQALERGELRCLPTPQIVGSGLESVNKACRMMGKGVSGTKLVVGAI